MDLVITAFFDGLSETNAGFRYNMVTNIASMNELFILARSGASRSNQVSNMQLQKEG